MYGQSHGLLIWSYNQSPHAPAELQPSQITGQW